MRAFVFVAALTGLVACNRGLDLTDAAAGQPPFEALRGIPASGLRVGQLRAYRREMAPLAGVGLQEIIDGQLVTFVVPVFDSTSLWPREEALILVVEVSRTWSSDSLAHVAWDSTARAVQAALPDTRPCAAGDPQGRWTALEFPRGDSLVLSAEYEPSYLLMDSTRTLPTTRLALRRGSRCATP